MLCAGARSSGISGITVAHFWIGLVLLGVGWNFAFIGATTMVTECHRPNERNSVQAFNDFLVFGSMAIGSFSSGSSCAILGWACGQRGGISGRLVGAALLLWGSLRNGPRLAADLANRQNGEERVHGVAFACKSPLYPGDDSKAVGWGR